MKLRVKSNSIRLRLTQVEVKRFAESGWVEEVIEFGAETGRQFIYCLQETEEGDNIAAVFEDNRLRVFVPKKMAFNWALSELVGLEHEESIGGGKTLHIVIEKDFACLECREGEDEKDAFLHPSIGKI